jgi:hypothetical protein
VCIFVLKDTHVNKIDISYNSKEKDLEICAVELETEASQIVLCLYEYRASTGDFKRFIKTLEAPLKSLYKP